jgi:hypothetical protein
MPRSTPRSPKKSKQDLLNLKKALPWRSPDEARLVRMFTWKYLLGHGPQCTPYALAKWLGVQESYIRHLRKKLPTNPTNPAGQAAAQAAFDLECQQNGPPTLEALREARIKSRSMRAKGLLRTQPRWKEIREPGQRTKSIPAKPAAITLVLDGKIPLEPPDRVASGQMGPPEPGHPAWRRPHRGRPKRKRLRNYSPGRLPGCSPEQARENLKKGKEPRRWRSPSESRLIRMFVWQWALGRGPNCSACALARWLGISDTYLRDLKRKLLRRHDGLRNGVRIDPLAEFLNEVGRHGAPTLDKLARARDESRWMLSENLLRTQRAFRTVKCAEYAGATFYEWIRTKPANVTLVLDGVTPLAPPSRVKPGQAAPDEFSTRMWQLRMREEVKKKMKPILPRRWRRR